MSTKTTPLRGIYEDLPSLAFSSSPQYESPKTQRHSGRFFRFPQAHLPEPKKLVDILSSSPPVAEAKTVQKTPRKTEKEANRRLSEVLRPTKRKLDESSSDELEEYSIMGSNYGFVVSKEGRVSLSPLRSRQYRKLELTREELLTQDSESENEEETPSNVEFDAIGAFARTLARSQLDNIRPTSSQQARNKLYETPRTNSGRMIFHSPHSVLAATPSTPLSTGSFQANIVTPPGAMLVFDNNQYSTGMTPYLPRS